MDATIWFIHPWPLVASFEVRLITFRVRIVHFINWSDTLPNKYNRPSNQHLGFPPMVESSDLQLSRSFLSRPGGPDPSRRHYCSTQATSTHYFTALLISNSVWNDQELTNILNTRFQRFSDSVEMELILCSEVRVKLNAIALVNLFAFISYPTQALNLQSENPDRGGKNV